MNDADIKNLITELLSGMGIAFDEIIIGIDPVTEKKVFGIKTKESGLLIGDQGENFYAFSHLLKRMAGKGKEEQADFFIDVNDYHQGLVDKLKVKATLLANRARDMKSNIEMDPMSSYERLIIHGALTNEPNIKTESVGEGRDRRIVIKYIEN